MNEIFVSDSANAQGEFLWSPLSQYQPAFRFFFCPPNLTNYIVPNQKKNDHTKASVVVFLSWKETPFSLLLEIESDAKKIWPCIGIWTK